MITFAAGKNNGMKYDFDEQIDRRGTGAYKLEQCEAVFGTADVQPLWVADMDFRTPDFILDAIRHRLEHPVLGYTVTPPAYYDCVVRWVRDRHGWDIRPEWMGFLAGIVPGLAHAVNAFTQPGDEVIVQPPVYPPFLHVPEKNGRRVVCNPLREVDGRFEMDFDDLEAKITPKTQLFILCNPHNPGGRTWDADTLRRLADICSRRGVLVLSDEIHADMALPGNRHIPFATLSEAAARNSLTYMAPSKTFNIPGLISSFYVIPDPELRQRFAAYLDSSELNTPNIFAVVATLAAYTVRGNEWRRQMLDYVQGNVDFVVAFCRERMPAVRPMVPQASFLVWLDFSACGLDSEALQHKMVHEAKVGLNQGTTFGAGGERHLRLNVACPRARVCEALERMAAALENGNVQ